MNCGTFSDTTCDAMIAFQGENMEYGGMLRWLGRLRKWLIADGYEAVQSYYRERRPAVIPEIEPELRAASPRPFVWDGVAPDDGERRRLLLHGVPTRAWVIGVRTVRNDPEGPDVYLTYAWEVAGDIRCSSLHRGYDLVHLYLGSPEYSDWVERAYVAGGTFTVLYDHTSPQEHVIYGELKPFVSGVWAAQ
jgi:hypothetical protein